MRSTRRMGIYIPRLYTWKMYNTVPYNYYTYIYDVTTREVEAYDGPDQHEPIVIEDGPYRNTYEAYQLQDLGITPGQDGSTYELVDGWMITVTYKYISSPEYTSYKKGNDFLGYVKSVNPNGYPNYGVSNYYWYEKV